MNPSRTTWWKNFLLLAFRKTQKILCIQSSLRQLNRMILENPNKKIRYSPRIKNQKSSKLKDQNFSKLYIQTPCWSELNFWKIEFEKSNWMNLVFYLFGTWFLLPVPARLKIKFIQLSFSNSISKKSSTDQQGDWCKT